MRWPITASRRSSIPAQRSQFTGSAFTGVLASSGIAISMDGKGAWRDNVFVERLWRSVKYEEVYLRAYEGVSDARASIGRYLDFYNGRRPHSSLWFDILAARTRPRVLSRWTGCWVSTAFSPRAVRYGLGGGHQPRLGCVSSP